MANADRIIELLHEAKSRPAGAARARFLDEACGDDSALKEQIVSLLEADANEGESDFLKITRIIRQTIPVTEKPGDRIGRYKLLEQIGEGGCGVVYMAEQEEPVRRRVALKVIKLGMDTKQVIARFEAERQALAMMDHPNIAKVLDGGATDTGRPFFVMELVRGIKITDYCDQNNLSTNDRLELFIQVCQAIQHAHQKGIIHRDIKPSNILVTQHDDVAVPKVIDFGIAKATIGQLTDKTVFTAFAQFMGTPAYMSPEQAQMSGLDIDTRADIYSLGVLLYELLTGNTPFDAKELLAAGMDEMRRKIREDEPARPSTCLSTMQAMDLTTVARRRHVEPPRLIHLIRGDLDWLVMKCLDKDRTRRYDTANGLAMDIQRHLNNEPVTACPPSRLYEFQKTVQRHKFGFAAAAALIIVLGLGVLASTWQAVRATRAEREQTRLRQQSETEAAKATAISDFLQQLLGSANPDALKGPEYTVRQLLDDFSAGLTNQLKDQPEVEATVRATIGRAYRQLGADDKAQAQHERALTLRRRIFGDQSEQVAETLVDFTWTFFQKGTFEPGEYAKGEPYVREALDIYRKRGTASQPVISALWVLQKILSAQGRYPEMDSVTEEALAIAGKSPGVEFPEMASMMHGLAEAKNRQAKYDEGASLARKAFEMHRRLRGAEHPETAWALASVGIALRGQQKLTEAEAVLREALRIFRKYYAPGDRSVDGAMNQLRLVLEARGDSAGVEALYREVLAGQRAALGNDSPAVAETLSSLAASLYAQGKLAEAEKASREAMEIIPKLRDQDLAKLLPVIRRLAGVLKSQGKALDAEKLYEETIQAARQTLGDSHYAVGELLHYYAGFLESEHKWEASAAQYIRSLPIRRANQNDGLAWTLRNLGGVLNQAGRPKDAEPYLRESLTLYHKLHQQEEIIGTAWTAGSLAFALYRQQRLPEAEQAYRETLQAYSKCNAVGTEDYAVQVRWFLDVLKAENKLAEGEALCRELLAQQRAAFTNDNLAVARTLSSLADNLVSQGKQAEAEPLFREAIALYEKAIASFPNNAELGWQLVELLRGQGKLADAEPVFRKALALLRKSVGNEHPEVANALHKLGDMLRDSGQWTEAEEAFREAVALRRKLFGNEHLDLGHSLHGLAWVLNHNGKRDEAEALSREELALRRKLLGNDHSEVSYALHDLACCLRDQGKLAEAETTVREALAIRRKRLGNDHPDAAASFNLLADLLRAQGKLAELEALYREELALRRELLGNEHLDVATSLSSLSMLFREQGKLPEAETTVREALAIRRKLLAYEHADVAQSLHLLAYNINLQGKHTEAEALSREEVAMWRKLLGNEHPNVAWALSDLTIFLRDQKKLPEAETTIRESLAIRRKAFGNDHPDTAASFNLLAGLLRAQGKLAELDKAEAEKKTVVPKP